MKKALFPAIIILMAALYFSCSKKKTNVEFDIPYTTDIAVPSMTAGSVYTLTTPNVMTDINEKLASYGTNGNLVGEVKYTTFDIAVKTPTAGNLSFIKWIKFFINATNLPEQQVSYKYNEGSDAISPTAKSTTLHVNDPNLKGRFMENSVYFKYKIESLSATAPMTLTISHKVHVKAISEK